jgi:hypothetical protein
MKTLKLATLFLGESHNYHLIVKSDVDSQRSIVQNAQLMLISVTLALLTGICVAIELFGSGFIGAAASGIGFAWFVMMLDRSIMNSIISDPWHLFWKKSARVTLSVLLALITSIGVDMMLYHNDVQKELTSEALTQAREEYQGNLRTLTDQAQKNLADKKATKLRLEEEFFKEMISGVGPRAQEKRILLAQAKTDLQEAESSLKSINASNTEELKIRTAFYLEQLNQSVLKKSAAVFHVAFSSKDTAFIYVLLLLVIVLMDILPAMSKNNELTGYENYIARTRYMQKVKSDLARETAESIARKSHDDGQRLRDLYKARSIVNRGFGTSLN